MSELVDARLLKPLGNTPPNSGKLFAVLELTKDRAWLTKVTQTLIQRWQKQKAAKAECPLVRLQPWSEEN